MKLAIGGGAALAGLVLATSIFVIAKPLSAGVPAAQTIQQNNQTAQISTSNAEAKLTAAETNNHNDETNSEAKAVTLDTVNREGETYSATAYCLPGKTASGRTVARGLIAADPRILPLGTRVMISAGNWSGEYLVADVGGGIKGKKIDIWVPNVNEARQIGRRNIKLTVISFPERKGKQRKLVGVEPIPVTEGQRPRVVQ